MFKAMQDIYDDDNDDNNNDDDIEEGEEEEENGRITMRIRIRMMMIIRL
jgi:hypothetical protein